ncbi:MAG: DsbA family protein [Rhodospirillales bacterium]|nr:DsbA family protein [Rhodospirillales bacterium]
MISRRFLIGAMATIPVAAVLAPVVPGRAAGIGERPGDLAVGDPDAPVTVIEFFSLTCPSCLRFHENVYNRLKPEYVDTGKVRFVARDFPLNAPALQAAVLAHCAGRDRYFTFIDVLFQTFDDWASSRDFTDKLGQIGELGGVSRDQFEACLNDKALENAIFQSIADGQAAYDVSGTPTLVVNGEKYEGKMTFDALARHIDRLLSGS